MAKRKSAPAAHLQASSPDQIDRSIIVVRGHKILLDEQLASFYGVQTKVLIQAVKRNIDRFPDDFMFQLIAEEWEGLRSQFVT
jgi:ORF6N domain